MAPQPADLHPNFEAAVDSGAVLEVVRQLHAELHGGQPEGQQFEASSTLERDLGFDSLSRVELLIRVEQKLGVRLPETTLAKIDNIGDLVRAVALARAALPSHAAAQVASKPAPPRSARGVPSEARTLNEVVKWRAQAHPHTPHLIVLEDGVPQTLTYAQLLEAAQRVAAGLIHIGVQPGVRIALMLPTGAGYFHAFFGSLLAGAVPVPIYPPTRPSQLEEHVHRYAGVLANAGAEVLITVPEGRSVAHLLRARIPTLKHLLAVGDLLELGLGAPPDVGQPKQESIALLQYTSGSTGVPKGVILTHQQLLANIRAMGNAVQATDADVFVSWLPLYHDMGLIGAWLGSLYFGCLLVIMSPMAFLARPSRWLRAIHDYRATFSAAPNFGYELCIRRIPEEELRELDLSSLRIVFNGAEPVSPDTVRGFQERFSRHGFKPEAMTPVYGLAEAAVGLSFPPTGRGPLIDRISRDKMMGTGRAVPVSMGETDALRFVSCGRPLPGYQIRIVGPGDAEVPERVEGTLQFTGPSATSGYYRSPAATEHLRHGEWLDTGDRGYFAGGEVYITGRVKDIIIRRGRHLYPDEIERAVGELDGVRKGCVAALGVPDAATASEQLIIVAETDVTDPTLSREIKARINNRVIDCAGEPPDEILLVPPHAVFKTSSGKLRRAATSAAYLDHSLGRAPRSSSAQLLRLALQGTAPTLRRMWQEGIRVLYGLYAWGVLLTVGVALGLLILLLPRGGPAWSLMHRMGKWLVRLWAIPFAVTRQGEFDFSRPHVVVANHCSYIDSFFIAALFPTAHVFVAKAELQRIPVVRTWLRKIGAVFVERFEAIESVRGASRLAKEIEAGRSLIVYPEGTFTRIPGLRPFRLGAFEAAVDSGVPVIPVVLRGTRSVLRDGTWLPRRLPVSAVVGQPLDVAPELSGFTAAVKLRDAVRARVLQYAGEPDLS